MSIYRYSLRALSHKRFILAAGFLVGFAVSTAMFFTVGVLSVSSILSHHLDHQIRSLDETSAKWSATMTHLDEIDQSDPCSNVFLQELRKVAFLPDGIHEIIYARDNEVLCSVTMGKLDQPIRLGEPNLVVRDGKYRIWTNQNLREFGQADLHGMLIGTGNFLMVVIQPNALSTPADWITSRITFDSQGELFEGTPSHSRFALDQYGCDTDRIFCVEASASPTGAIADRSIQATVALVVALVFGFASMRAVQYRLDRLWAFPNRFRKLMDDDSVYCVYQPILSFDEGRINAIEVLARWRDITGETVMPSEFLPVAEEEDMTRRFTEILVRNAYRDLQSLPDQGARINIHFNIYPQDFDADWLLAIFAPLLALKDRFGIVVEILERQQIPLEQVRDTVETLNANGISTYVDDFGTGYSNIEFLGHLALTGVKLDRSFGQAPEGSVMALLQASAAGMIASTGYKVLVEGVETAEKLEFLRRSGVVNQAQGYYIARPLAFANLVNFLATYAYKRARPSKPRLRKVV